MPRGRDDRRGEEQLQARTRAPRPRAHFGLYSSRSKATAVQSHASPQSIPGFALPATCGNGILKLSGHFDRALRCFWRSGLCWKVVKHGKVPGTLKLCADTSRARKEPNSSTLSACAQHPWPSPRTLATNSSQSAFFMDFSCFLSVFAVAPCVFADFLAVRHSIVCF